MDTIIAFMYLILKIFIVQEKTNECCKSIQCLNVYPRMTEPSQATIHVEKEVKLHFLKCASHSDNYIKPEANL